MSALDLIQALDPCQKATAALHAIMAIAESQTGTSYGKNRDLAVAYLTLHMLALQVRNKASGGAAVSGQITSETEGDLSRSYAAPASGESGGGSAEASLAQTSWGKELIRLRKGSFIAGGLRNRMDCA